MSDMEQEIERLERMNDKLIDENRALQGENLTLLAKVQNLTGDVERLRDQHEIRDIAAEITKEEVERLRTALRQIADLAPATQEMCLASEMASIAYNAVGEEVA